jgi:hypothetical protein
MNERRKVKRKANEKKEERVRKFEEFIQLRIYSSPPAFLLAIPAPGGVA